MGKCGHFVSRIAPQVHATALTGVRPRLHSARRTFRAKWVRIPKRTNAEEARLFGAGDGNRTHVSSLGSYSSTIELRPQCRNFNSVERLNDRLIVQPNARPFLMTPAEIVQVQLDAYNRKDVDALLQTFAPDAEQFELHGQLIAKGHGAMRERFAIRFTEPDLHARLISRNVMGHIVVDHEEITRNFPEGIGTIEMLCVYEVRDGTIVKASYASSAPRLLR
jgi:hypothetical protein